jgi:cytochrome c oxidase assembly protein subunit 15
MSATVHQLPYAPPVKPRPWYKSPVYLLAMLTTIATFPLIFMGGLVTSNGAGLAVPDWPNSYGYNMFLFPPRYWVGGIFYEHTHRLLGTVVGFLSILLCIAAWRTEPRRWARWLAISVLPASIIQGTLGGLRVLYKNLVLAMIHACAAQAFLCLAATVVVVSSHWWKKTPNLSGGSNRSLFRTAAITVAIIYLQLIVGATMRHEQAGLAIPDFPLTFGHILPPAPSAVDDAFRTSAMHNWPDPALSLLAHVTAWQIYLQFAHRVGGVFVTIAVCWLATMIFRSPARKHLSVLAGLLLLLLVTQITLGILSVLLRKPADIASLHVAVGALTLVTTYIIAVRCARLFWPAPAAAAVFAPTVVSSPPLPLSPAPPLA